MMSLLKWEAKILNQLLKTNVFQQIVLDHTDLNQIDYKNIYRILEQHKIQQINQSMRNGEKFNIEQLVESANKVCQPTLQSKLVRDQIIKLNSLVLNMGKNLVQSTKQNVNQINQLNEYKNQQMEECLNLYSIQHVIIYSTLSKCRIWPKMLKSSASLVPELIRFYNQFTKDFSYDLSYKFDVVILTHKYQKVMNKIQQRKKSFPQLFKAIGANDIKLIGQLIQSLDQKQKERDFLNQCKKQNLSVCHHAVMYANLDTMRVLYERYHLDFQRQDHEQQTALFYAVKRNEFQIVKFLVEQAKVDINHKQYQNRTPIYLGAFEGNLKIVDYLYSKGANPQMQSKLSRTPLSKACYLGNVSVAEYLIRIGVNLTTIDSKGRTALHNAAWGIQGGRQGKKKGSIKLEDSPQCAQLLLRAGHPVDVQDFDGFTPLMSAAASLAIKSMKVLIKYGANLKHKTKKNETVVFVAAKYGHLQSIKILIEQFNCEYQQPICHGVTPLDASFTVDTTDVSKYLLDLYYYNKKAFSFQSLVKCLCYYKKQQNLNHLLEWAEQDQDKKDYILRSLKFQIQNKDNFIADLFENQNDLLPCFLRFFQAQIQKLDFQIVQFIVDRSVQAYKRGMLPNFPQFLCQNCQILQAKNVTIKNLQIQIHTKQEDIIKLLSIDTNMTQNNKTIYRCMLFLVKRRMTKVLLWILTLHDSGSQGPQKMGLCKLDKNQIYQIVECQTQEHNSIQNYCYIHGIHDVVKILQSSQKQIKVYIPKYQYAYSIDQNPHPTGTLMPVKQHFFDFKFLLKSHLSQQQAQFYTQNMIFYNKRIHQMGQRIQIVQNPEDLQRMRNHFKNCRLIGVDIEHFNNSNQEFICLVQLSGFGQTFIIDTLKVQKQHITEVLEEIMNDEDRIKIFHSYEQDLKWIGQDFQIEVFKSVIDTSKIYGLINPKNKSPSLKFLAETVLSQVISKDFQRSDWRIRPLFKQMKVYAGTDALLLPFIYLKQLMQANVQIQNQKDTQFYQQVRKHFGTKRYIKCKGRKNHLKIPQQ